MAGTAPESSEVAQAFAAVCLGEWAGWQCEFSTTTGKLVPLSADLVPAELADWGMAPVGLQVLVSESWADGSTQAIERRLLRLLPATG